MSGGDCVRQSTQWRRVMSALKLPSWDPGPSSCLYELEQTAGRLQHKWELAKVGDEWKVVESKETMNVESSVAETVAARDEAVGERAERNDNGAGLSGINPLPDGPIAPPLTDGPRSYWT